MVQQLAVAEVGSGRAPPSSAEREGLRRGGKPLGVRLRHRQEALDQSEDHGRPSCAPTTASRPTATSSSTPTARRSGRLASATRWTLTPAKALVKLDIEGIHDASWLTQAGAGAFGQSVVDHDGKLYLAAGGSDFLAEYDKTAKGARGWVRDTSGSAQAVEVLDGQAGGRRDTSTRSGIRAATVAGRGVPGTSTRKAILPSILTASARRDRA